MEFIGSNLTQDGTTIDFEIVYLNFLGKLNFGFEFFYDSFCGGLVHLVLLNSGFGFDLEVDL